MIAGAFLLILLQGAPAYAVEQIPAAEAPQSLTSPTAQIGASVRRVEPARAAPRSIEASQLNGQPRSARPPQGPRPPARMRANLEPVSGADRCDPARAEAAPEVCANAIERRADDFTPPPSPEARLLSEVDDLGSVDADLAARRLAEGDIRSSEVAQAVAYQSGLKPPPAKPDPNAMSPETQRAVDVVGAILGLGSISPR